MLVRLVRLTTDDGAEIVGLLPVAERETLTGEKVEVTLSHTLTVSDLAPIGLVLSHLSGSFLEDIH